MTGSGAGGPASPPPFEVLRSNLKAVSVMLLAVGLQVAGAVVLKTLADHRVSWGVLLLAVGISVVVLINLARLAVWGVAHKRFALSSTFPLSSLFYPVMLGVALAYGDQIGPQQVLGAVLITSGTVWLTMRVRA